MIQNNRCFKSKSHKIMKKKNKFLLGIVCSALISWLVFVYVLKVVIFLCIFIIFNVLWLCLRCKLVTLMIVACLLLQYTKFVNHFMVIKLARIKNDRWKICLWKKGKKLNWVFFRKSLCYKVEHRFSKDINKQLKDLRFLLLSTLNF